MPTLKHRQIPELSAKDIARFKNKIDKRGPDECWPWTAGRMHYKQCFYGWFQLTQGPFLAHRISYFLHYGVDPGPLVVRHSCDEGTCQNWKHLIAGTQLENIADMVDRKRASRGERSGNSKLKAFQVADIKEQCRKGANRLAMAKKYSVSLCNIYAILKGRTWKHVP